MTPIIFHIDVNSAFLSWTAVEMLEQGAKVDLREIPAIIGGDPKSRHGVVLAKSVPAKKFGIHTGEPVANAFRKYPHLITAPPNHAMYRRKSEELMTYLKTFSGKIEQVSVDECYMDVTKEASCFPSVLDAALQIKNGVKETFGFTVNVGISSNKLLAKMASDFEKPDKIHTLFPEEIEEKMWPLPVGELFMAGRSSVEILKKLEIYTIGDLAKADRKLLSLHLKSHGKMLWEFANGIGDANVQAEQTKAKGIGNSITLSEDVATYEEAIKVFDGLADSVSRRLQKAGQKAGSVTIEVKYSDFHSISHQTQLMKSTDEKKVLLETAGKLFQESWNQEPVRLLGIRTAKLSAASAPEQLSIFDIEIPEEPDEKHQKLNAAMEEIRKKYGKNAIMKASVLPRARNNHSSGI